MAVLLGRRLALRLRQACRCPFVLDCGGNERRRSRLGTTKTAGRLVGGSAVLGPSWRQLRVAEEARTRGFAAPAFAGCAFCYELAAKVTIACGADLVNLAGQVCHPRTRFCQDQIRMGQW